MTPAHEKTRDTTNQIKPPDIELEDKIKINVVFCITVDSSTTKEGKPELDICVTIIHIHDVNVFVSPT